MNILKSFIVEYEGNLSLLHLTKTGDIECYFIQCVKPDPMGWSFRILRVGRARARKLIEDANTNERLRVID